MSSSDEEVASPQLGASSSKDPVTPLDSESDDDDFVIKKLRNNKRPRDASCSKDRQPVTPDASESDDGEKRKPECTSVPEFCGIESSRLRRE